MCFSRKYRESKFLSSALQKKRRRYRLLFVLSVLACTSIDGFGHWQEVVNDLRWWQLLQKRVVWQLLWFQVNDWMERWRVNCEGLTEKICFGTAYHSQWTPTAGLDHQGSRTHFIRARTTSRHGWNLGAALMGQSRLHDNIYLCRTE